MATNGSALLRWSNIVAFVLTVIVNGLAGSTTLLGGVNTAEISDSNPTLITPAGYTFAIWGIIYILLGFFVVFQALPRQRGKEWNKQIGWLFVLSSIINIAWLFLWQYELLSLSLILMFMLLATLILIYTHIGIGKTPVSFQERIAVHTPFSVYLGWITIATIANVAVTAVSINWDGFGINLEIWAILIITVALTLTLIVVATRKDIAYGLVVVWALTGIASKQTENPDIVGITEISIVIILLAIIVTFIILLKIPKTEQLKKP